MEDVMAFIRKVLPFLGVAMAVALVHLAWVMASREAANRRMEAAAAARQARSARGLPPSPGDALRIPWFYANRGDITEGEHAVVCYGVENARRVRLEPAVERLTPAYNRCFAVEPESTTRYTLVAADAAGREVSASFTIRVNPAPPSILFVSISDREIRRGHPFTLCYGVRHATSVRLDPLNMTLTPVEKSCRRWFPLQTTQFTLVASDDAGRADREKFTLTVR
jgi:hypothetical protein